MDSVSNSPIETAAASHSTIVATATALPPHTITREDMKYYKSRRVEYRDQDVR